MTPTGEKRSRLRTFGRIAGRPLSKRQQDLIDTRLDGLRPIGRGQEGSLLRREDLFRCTREIWLEVGFGGGEHLAQQASRHSDIGFIGCEPFIEGVAKALVAIEENQLDNVLIHDDDARLLIDRLAPGTVDRIFILFPDPWPKKRHQKRRIIQPDFLEALVRVCRPGARVRFATDVSSYADEALAIFLNDGRFDWTAERADDWRLAPADHIETRYEVKRLGDCLPVFYDFTVRPDKP